MITHRYQLELEDKLEILHQKLKAKQYGLVSLESGITPNVPSGDWWEEPYAMTRT